MQNIGFSYSIALYYNLYIMIDNRWMNHVKSMPADWDPSRDYHGIISDLARLYPTEQRVLDQLGTISSKLTWLPEWIQSLVSAILGRELAATRKVGANATTLAVIMAINPNKLVGGISSANDPNFQKVA